MRTFAAQSTTHQLSPTIAARLHEASGFPAPFPSPAAPLEQQELWLHLLAFFYHHFQPVNWVEDSEVHEMARSAYLERLLLQFAEEATSATSLNERKVIASRYPDLSQFSRTIHQVRFRSEKQNLIAIARQTATSFAVQVQAAIEQIAVLRRAGSLQDRRQAGVHSPGGWLQ